MNENVSFYFTHFHQRPQLTQFIAKSYNTHIHTSVSFIGRQLKQRLCHETFIQYGVNLFLSGFFEPPSGAATRSLLERFLA